VGLFKRLFVHPALNREWVLGSLQGEPAVQGEGGGSSWLSNNHLPMQSLAKGLSFIAQRVAETLLFTPLLTVRSRPPTPMDIDT